MAGINRKQFLLGSGAAMLAPFAPVMAAVSPLDKVNNDWVVSEWEALTWHEVKDQNGPALTGNASWHNFMEFLEARLRDYGCVDVSRSPGCSTGSRPAIGLMIPNGVW